MSVKQTFAWVAFALCLVACEASTTPPASTAKETGPEGSALQALVAKTKKNLVFVEGGTFEMGDFGVVHNDEKLPYYGALDTMPLHKVTLDSFSIAAYKMTYEDYDIYTEANGLKKLMQDPRDIEYKRRKAPVGVHWQAARDYCQWLGKQVGTPMDLPTEAQWEYAARNRGQMVIYATDNGKIEAGRNVPTYEWLEEHNQAEGVYSSIHSVYEVGLLPLRWGWSLAKHPPLRPPVALNRPVPKARPCKLWLPRPKRIWCLWMGAHSRWATLAWCTTLKNCPTTARWTPCRCTR